MSFLPPSRSRDCRRARSWISRALDDDLGETERVRLSEHIGACTECRRHQEVLEQGRRWMQAAEAEPSENFEWKVQLGIQKALRERAAEGSDGAVVGGVPSFWRPALASAAAVAVLVVMVGTWVLSGSEGPVPPTSGSGTGPADPIGGVARTTAPVSDDEPDLSGAVPGTPFEFGYENDRFGVRMVGGPGFSGDVYAPMRQERQALWPTLPRSMQSTIMHHLFRSGHAGGPAHRDVQGLNLPMRRSTLPAADVGDSNVAGSTVERH
jgi:hypothetical protein